MPSTAKPRAARELRNPFKCDARLCRDSAGLRGAPRLGPPWAPRGRSGPERRRRSPSARPARQQLRQAGARQGPGRLAACWQALLYRCRRLSRLLAWPAAAAAHWLRTVRWTVPRCKTRWNGPGPARPPADSTKTGWNWTPLWRLGHGGRNPAFQLGVPPADRTDLSLPRTFSGQLDNSFYRLSGTRVQTAALARLVSFIGCC